MPSPRRRRVPAAAAAAVLALSAAAVAAASLDEPQRGGARAGAPAATQAYRTGHASLSTRTATRLLAAQNYWGGRYTIASGEQVTVLVSDELPQDPAFAQRWADYLGSLVHGAELSTVTVYLGPRGEVRANCGPGAVACYSPQQRLIVAPTEASNPALSLEAILAHEYGHHVAASRLNPPWDAGEWGTKRWATYEQVCSEAAAGRLFPGAQEDRSRYIRNPGEVFAEAYRLLNERKAGRTETAWDVVASDLYPDDASLVVLEQDVLSPWRAAAVSTLRGSFTRRGTATRTYAVSTPLDGNLRVTLRAPATARLRVEIRRADGGRLAQTAVGGGARTAETTVCGLRSHSVRVTRLTGFGAYRLTVTRP